MATPGNTLKNTVHLRIAPRYKSELKFTSRFLKYLREGDQVTLHEPNRCFDESMVSP